MIGLKGDEWRNGWKEGKKERRSRELIQLK